MSANLFPRPVSTPRQRGFTIIELLVAAGITVVLVTLMISITTGILETWNRTTGRLSAHNQAKLALDILARDLQSMLLKRDANVWLAASIQSDQTSNSDGGDAGPRTAVNWNASFAVPSGINAFGKPLANGRSGNPLAADANAASLEVAPASRRLEDYRFGHAGMWLRFFTRQSDDMGAVESISAPVAVGYQLARIPVKDGLTSNTSPVDFPDLRWALFRTQARSGPFTSSGISASNRSTLGVGFNIVANEYQTATGAGGGGTAGDPGVIRRPNKFADLLAENVIDFGLRVYQRNATGQLVLVFPTDDSFTAGSRAWCYLATDVNNLSSPTAPSAPYNTNADAAALGVSNIVRGQPAAIELYIRVLTADGVRKLQSLELGRIAVPVSATSGGAYWWELAIQNSVTFTRRVDLPIQTF